MAPAIPFLMLAMTTAQAAGAFDKKMPKMPGADPAESAEAEARRRAAASGQRQGFSSTILAGADDGDVSTRRPTLLGGA